MSILYTHLKALQVQGIHAHCVCSSEILYISYWYMYIVYVMHAIYIHINKYSLA